MRVNLASDPAPLLAQLGWAVAPPQAEHRPPPCRVLTHCQQTECGPASAAAFHAPAPAMPPPLNTSKLRVFLLEGHTGPMNDMLHTMTTTLGVPLNQIGFMLLSQAMEFRRHIDARYMSGRNASMLNPVTVNISRFLTMPNWAGATTLPGCLTGKCRRAVTDDAMQREFAARFGSATAATSA